MAFEHALNIILRNEGGYVNHPNDRGGATNKGVTQAVYDNWRLNRGLAPRSVRSIDDGEVSSIYYAGYWVSAGCDRMPPKLALAVFDAAVNHGPKRAVKFLQKILGTLADGAFGAKSLSALEHALTMEGEAGLVERYLDERAWFYDAIVARDPSQAVFRRGWGNRLASLRKDMKEFA